VAFDYPERYRHICTKACITLKETVFTPTVLSYPERKKFAVFSSQSAAQLPAFSPNWHYLRNAPTNPQYVTHPFL